MNKNELLNKLIDRLVSGTSDGSTFYNGYNAGIIDAIKMVHALPDFAQKEVTDMSPADRVRNEIWKYGSLFAMFTNTQLEQLVSEIVSGHALNAVKLYKEITGMGLKESKEAVDKIKSPLSSVH